MDNNQKKQTGGYEYINQSRGYKTKGNTYKDRYVEAKCPECEHDRAYKDTWKTRIAFTCLKRSCRHKWYIALTPEQIQAEKEIQAAIREAAYAREQEEGNGEGDE